MKETPELIGAVRDGDASAVRALLNAGADVAVTDSSGRGPLSLAAQLGHREVVAALVSAGLSVTTTDPSGESPLVNAAAGGHTAVATYLLMNGADARSSRAGMPSWEIAKSHGHEELAVLLQLAACADLQLSSRLARSVAASPTCPSDEADRLIVTMLLEEKGLDTRFEPLLTGFLHELRRERPRPEYDGPPQLAQAPDKEDHMSQRHAPDARSTPRFTGVPPEVVTRTWVVGGSDRSVFAGTVDAFEESAMAVFVNEGGTLRQVTPGGFPRIVNKAVEELRGIRIDDHRTALTLFEEYYERIAASPGMAAFHCALRAAIMLYTDDRFFRVLNGRWRSSESQTVLGISTLMSMAFRHAKYFLQGEVFRGVDLADAEHYRRGLVFRWPFFVSASTDRDVAAQFGETLVTIEVPVRGNVRDIAYLSLFPGECEVLLRAYEVFEVLEADSAGIRLRLFYEEWFGTGWEITEGQEVREIE